MSMPVGHVYYAQEFLRAYSRFDQKTFMAGTLLPDIRYLKVVDKERTHQYTELDTIINSLDAFNAGMQFHAWVDRQRDERIKAYNIHDLYLARTYYDSVLKLYEDMLLYPKVKAWDQILADYREPMEEEVAFVDKPDSVKKWHNALCDYMAKPPSIESVQVFMRVIDLSGIDIEEIRATVGAIREEPQVAERLDAVHREIISEIG